MAITKILPRNGGLKSAIAYVLNRDKTDEQILTAHLNCDPGHAYQQMMDTKRELGKMDGRQCYHIIQSFVPGEITPALALEIATEFAKEHLAGYQVVIGTHTDRHHIHSHILFNSVNDETGEKYHCSRQDYYRQIRAVSDRLCWEHGLSIIMQGETGKSMSYIEWLRQSKGQPTYRSMLEADLRVAMEDANELDHFFMLMEDMGYEIKHGKRLGFRLPGQEHFMYPERKNSQYSEEGIRNYISGNLIEISAGRKPVVIYREPYHPYKKHPKYKGFLALYVHYLYVLGKIQKQQYPPKMTPQMRKDVMRFEQLQEQFKFLMKHGIETESQMQKLQAELQTEMATLTKQRTILNVKKKKRKALFQALSDVKSLTPAKELYETGQAGFETEYQQYIDASALLNNCGISREGLAEEKAKIYEKLANLNREIRQCRKDLKMCQEITGGTPNLEHRLQRIDPPQRNQQKEWVQAR